MEQLDVQFFKPFVEGTLHTLKVQCSLEAKPGKPYFKGSEKEAENIEIAAVIGLTSNAFNGSITLCFPKNVFLTIMSNMMGETYSEITNELEDGAAELLNIIFGQAKKVLNEKDYSIQKAIPTVVRGSHIHTTHLTKNKIVVLPFTTERGNLYIEISTESKSL